MAEAEGDVLEVVHGRSQGSLREHPLLQLRFHLKRSPFREPRQAVRPVATSATSFGRRLRRGERFVAPDPVPACACYFRMSQSQSSLVLGSGEKAARKDMRMYDGLGRVQGN